MVICHLHTMSYGVVSERLFPSLLVWSVKCFLGLWLRSVQRRDTEVLRSRLVTQPVCSSRLLEASGEVVYCRGFGLGIGYLDFKIYVGHHFKASEIISCARIRKVVF